MTTPPFPATPDGPALYAVAVPALALAVLLIGVFAWGSHHLNRRRPKPARDTPAAPAARAGSRRVGMLPGRTVRTPATGSPRAARPAGPRTGGPTARPRPDARREGHGP
ncbi:hypothetical protein ACIQOV_14625 [Kitasatospora sp. NPDC091257]|uniref:hypothetical protein n=1 Tax=Kitasatospora sp. NPDC091257 TaxID=3364084 RepID=UPI0038099653